MIVQCTSCQTKFRVPDEKVGDKPVKVRCSKCTTIFAVTRAQALPEAAKAGVSGPQGAVKKGTGTSGTLPAARTGKTGGHPAAQAKSLASTPAAPSLLPPSPFAAFDPAQGPTGEPTTPHHFQAGIDASRPPATDFDVTNPGVDLGALAASRQPAPPLTLNEFKAPDSDPFANLDFSALGGGAPPPPSSPTLRVPPATPDAQMTLGPPSGPPAPLRPTESDPFANFDLSAPGIKSAATALVSGSDPFANFDLSSPAAPPPLPAPAAPAATESDPFANLSFGGPPPAGGPAPAAAESAPADSDPFANLDLGALVAKPGTRPPTGGAAPSLPAAVAPAPVPAPISAPAAAATAPAPGAHLDDFFGDVSAAPDSSMPGASTGGAPDDFFGAHGSVGESAEPSNPGGGGIPGSGHDRSLFDLPPPPPPTARPPSLVPEVTSAPTGGAAKAKAKPAPSAPTGTPEPSTGARLVSMVFNGLLVAAVAWGSLVGFATYRNEGHFDPALLRPAGLSRAILGASSEGGVQLVAEDVTNGLYPTAQGKQVFYVRGKVVNRAKGEAGPAEVKVEVLDGSKVLATGAAWASGEATPERLYNLTDAASLAALVKDEQAEAKSLRSGAAQPFVVVLLDYPDDLASRTLKVTVGVPSTVAQK